MEALLRGSWNVVKNCSRQCWRKSLAFLASMIDVVVLVKKCGFEVLRRCGFKNSFFSKNGQILFMFGIGAGFRMFFSYQNGTVIVQSQMRRFFVRDFLLMVLAEV